MYVLYNSTTSWTMNQLTSDIALLASGSPLSALSASCNIGTSTRTATIAPGWTLFDNSISAQTFGGQILSCLDRDSLTTKYLNVYGVSATGLNFRMYETWTAGTDTGTNVSTVVVGPTFTSGTAFSLHIFVTPEYIIVSNTTTTSLCCLEILRDTPFLTSTATQNTVGVVCTGANLGTGVNSTLFNTRITHPTTAAAIVGTAANMRPMTIGPTSDAAAGRKNPITTQCIGTNSIGFHPTYPIFAGYSVTDPATYYYGRIADNGGDFVMTTTGTITSALTGDTMVVNGVNYWYSTSGFVVPIK